MQFQKIRSGGQGGVLKYLVSIISAYNMYKQINRLYIFMNYSKLQKKLLTKSKNDSKKLKILKQKTLRTTLTI